MSKKRVKIAKYTKEKNAEAWRKFYEEQAKIKYSMLNNMHYMIMETWRNARGFFFVMLLLLILELMGNLLDTYTDKYVIEFALGTSSRVTLGVICVVIISVRQLTQIPFRSGHLYATWVGKMRLRNHLLGQLMKKKMHISYESTENTKINDMLNKASEGAEKTADAGLFMVRDTILAVLQIAAYSGILSMLSPVLILIIALPAVAGYRINRHKMMWIWNMADNWQNYDRQMEYVTNVGNNFREAKDIRIFGMQQWFDCVYHRVFDKRTGWFVQQDEWELRHNLLETTVTSIGNVGAMVYIVYLVMNGRIGAGDFVLYFNSVAMLCTAVRNLCEKFSAFNWLSQEIFYLRDYLELEEKPGKGGEKEVPQGQCEIEFKHVSYTHFGAERPTIKDISFKLKKGENLAVVGLNGAGKTTLIKLMCGLYEPTEGEILLNGTPVGEYNREEYFKIFSTVFQDIDVLPVTIAENIAGKKWEEIDFQKLYDCMRKSGIDQKVMSLPKGERTRLVKSLYEDATDFSGGQMQKLALAKALYKNAPVLLLDEPTAALDPIAEQEMYLNYAEFSKEKSSVFISHRLASTRFCDRIILSADGQIKEEGSHSSLMELGGAYAELFHMQSSYYHDSGLEGDADE
ncbi:MAG: ABC transporter ATP-binding protein/permease [Lachnospiraceae bacterium]|nr:ABC transporter ATP-binding protein/permease [Lachnospiraceae bacterium]